MARPAPIRDILHRASNRLRHLVSMAVAVGAPRRVQRWTASVLAPLLARWPALAKRVGGSDEAALVARVPTRAAGAPPAIVTSGPTIEALIAALRDPIAEVAVKAVEALRQHPVEQAAPPLRAVVDNADGYFSSMARAAAVRALSELLPPGALRPVEKALRDVDAEVSLAAIAGLVQRSEGAPALLALLEDTTGFFLPVTRQAAARALARMNTEDSHRTTALLQLEGDPAVRDALAARKGHAEARGRPSE